jgi:hypothetical protein
VTRFRDTTLATGRVHSADLSRSFKSSAAAISAFLTFSRSSNSSRYCFAMSGKSTVGFVPQHVEYLIMKIEALFSRLCQYTVFAASQRMSLVNLDVRNCGCFWNPQCSDEVQLYAFDLLAMDGDDLRDLPLSMRKANLQRLLARRPEGISIALFEQREIGPDLFRKTCNLD